MKRIELRTGRLIYYGSAVGYQDGQDIVADPMFQSEELEKWLSDRNLQTRWVEGVYDRISGGREQERGKPDGKPLRSLRIWQLKQDAPFEMRFISLELMRRKYGDPPPAFYRVAYDGRVESNDLETIWSLFCHRRAEGFDHPLSISDVVELYDERGSEFYYVDRAQIVPIGFGEQGGDVKMTMTS